MATHLSRSHMGLDGEVLLRPGSVVERHIVKHKVGDHVSVSIGV